MLNFRLVFLALLGIISVSTSGYAQQRAALLINRSAKDNILVYCDNVLLMHKKSLVRPGDTLRIAFDENSFTHVSVGFVVAGETPVLALWPGDVVSVRFDRAANTYAFAGSHPAELQFFEKVWHSPLCLAGPPYELPPYELPATNEAFMRRWQHIRQAGDSLVAALRTTPGIRPVVAAELTRELRLRVLNTLLLPARYHEREGPVREFPAAYRDSVRAQFKYLRSVQDLPLAASEERGNVLSNYLCYKALVQGHLPTFAVQYALAKAEYRGAVREWACYDMLRRAQSISKPVDSLLADYRSWMKPDSKFVRQLLGPDQPMQEVLNQQLTGTDVLSRSDGTTLTLAELLAQHKGKVIYLDFWASWCAPCVQQLPASAALRQYYQGKEVVVVYLSIDKDQQQWQRARAKFLPDAPEQYCFASAGTSQFLRHFAVTSIPRYMLIDPGGVLRYGQAFHPDNPALKERVTTLLTH